MRHYISSFCALAITAWIAHADSVTLTTTNQSAVTGKILSVSPRTGTVKIRKETGTAQLELSELTEESRETALLWKADKNFLLKSKTEVDFRPHDSNSLSNIPGTVTDPITGKTKEQTIGKKHETTREYTITLKNKSDTTYRNLEIEYRIFYTQPLMAELTGQYQLAGNVECESIHPEKVFQFKTTPFNYLTYYASAPGIRWTGKPPGSQQATVLGILLRIRKKGFSGEWIEQEVELEDVPRGRDRDEFQKIYK